MKPNTFRHNQFASVASLRRLFAFPGTRFGFRLESLFTFTGTPTLPEIDARNRSLNYSLYFAPYFRYRAAGNSQLEPVECP
jgi:hypothetical protein